MHRLLRVLRSVHLFGQVDALREIASLNGVVKSLRSETDSLQAQVVLLTAAVSDIHTAVFTKKGRNA